MRLRGLLILAASAAIVLVPAAMPATLPQLIGSVGPGFSITIEHPDGSAEAPQLPPRRQGRQP
jgi:hypothetical protein